MVDGTKPADGTLSKKNSMRRVFLAAACRRAVLLFIEANREAVR
jgi:hypothetical protein